MSNDSNEQGNDTAAPAFQVGDRVRSRETGHEGTVIAVTTPRKGEVAPPSQYQGNIIQVQIPDGAQFLFFEAEIERATPAANERIGACLVCEQYRTRAECCQIERDETCVYVCLVCGNAIDESDTGRQRSAASEPATPAPAQTVDLQQVERSISVAFAAINDAGSLSTDQTEDVVCRALDAIGAALGDLRNAVRQLAQDHQARS